MKSCTKCKIEKPLSSFSKYRHSKDGHESRCKKCRYEYIVEYRKRNKEKIKQYHKQYWKQYYLDNREKRIQYNNKYTRNKIKTDPNYKLRVYISILINRSLKGKKNGHSWESLVDYNQEELRNHLESQFADGMTWENYGRNGWVIDHIIPVSLFNIDSPRSKGFKKCWALENLRPMWEHDNLVKNNKLFY